MMRNQKSGMNKGLLTFPPSTEVIMNVSTVRKKRMGWDFNEKIRDEMVEMN